MLSFIIGFSVIILILIFIYGFVNYNLKNMLDKFTNKSEHFTTLSLSPSSSSTSDSVRPVDECVKQDKEGENKVQTSVAVGIPDAPFKYNDYVGSIYLQKDNNELGKENGPYCVKKPKLLYDGVWSPYLYAKNGWETVEWSLTNGNLFEGEVCMKSLYNTLKPMPKWSNPDCPVKCLNECEDFYVYCNGPEDNDKQDITDPNDSSVICFPSVFSPDGNKNPTTKIGF